MNIKTNTKRLMIVAGGTGGHIFPGLSIANDLIAKGWEVHWLGTINRMESTLVPKYGINISYININNNYNKNNILKIIKYICLFYSCYQARKIIYTWKPNIVLGMGGYISGPGILAAWSMGIPIILHEQNSIAGLTNRILSKISCKVLQAFPNAFSTATVVGNPIRNSILSIPNPTIRFYERTGPMRILIVGGSQGAHVLNKIIPQVARQLVHTAIFWHQTGKEEFVEVNHAYVQAGIEKYKIVEFIDDISTAYAWADIIICRSGALTVSEISAVGLPAIFVPFLHKDYQQYWNAKILEQAGAAKIIEQSNFTVKNVIDILSDWNRTKLLNMAKRAKKIAILNSTQLITQEIISMYNIINMKT